MKLNTFEVEMLLIRRSMTRAALAEACGLCRQNISTILRRGTCAPLTAAKLAAGLGVDPAEIIKQEGA